MAFKNTNLWIIRIGLYIVPFIPLYISKVLFFPYITGKAFVFRIIVEIIFAAWILLAIFYKEYRPRKTVLLTAISIFIFVVVLATVFGINPYKSFWSNFERMEGLVAHLHLFAYFLVLAHVFKKKDWLVFWNLFIVAGLLENTYALFQKLGYLASPQGGFRVDGTIGNPTYVAAYLVFVLAFCILLWLQTQNKIAKWYYGLSGFWTLATIYFTASRGPILGLLAGALVAGVLYFIFTRKKAILAVLVVLVAVAGGLWLLRETSFVKGSRVLTRLTSLSLTERTITSRFTIWGMGWQGLKERPILGWGPENYSAVFAKYFQPELWNQEPWFDRSHNIIFDWLINAGILGLLSYLGIFVTALYSLWNQYLKQNVSIKNAILFSALFVVYLFQNLFVFDQITTYVSFFTVLAYFQSTVVTGVEPAQLRKKIEPISVGMMAGLLLVPLVLIIYFVNAKPLFANTSLLNAMKIQGQDIQGAFEKYDKALSYNTLGNQEIREQFIHYVLAVGGISQLDAGFRDTIIRRAIQEAEKGIQENPLDPRPYLYLGVIYSRIGLLDDALRVMGKALELSPQKQQISFELADIYIQKGDYKSAISVLKTALDAAPDNSFARTNLVAVYILSGQQEEADRLLIEAFGTVDVAENILVQVYSRTKNYERLARIWQAFLKAEPDNPQYKQNLEEILKLLRK